MPHLTSLCLSWKKRVYLSSMCAKPVSVKDCMILQFKILKMCKIYHSILATNISTHKKLVWIDSVPWMKQSFVLLMLPLFQKDFSLPKECFCEMNIYEWVAWIIFIPFHQSHSKMKIWQNPHPYSFSPCHSLELQDFCNREYLSPYSVQTKYLSWALPVLL